VDAVASVACPLDQSARARQHGHRGASRELGREPRPAQVPGPLQRLQERECCPLVRAPSTGHGPLESGESGIGDVTPSDGAGPGAAGEVHGPQVPVDRGTGVDPFGLSALAHPLGLECARARGPLGLKLGRRPMWVCACWARLGIVRGLAPAWGGRYSLHRIEPSAARWTRVGRPKAPVNPGLFVGCGRSG